MMAGVQNQRTKKTTPDEAIISSPPATRVASALQSGVGSFILGWDALGI